MATTVRITNLLAGSSSPLLASGDVVPFVDVSDTTQSPQGSTVKATISDFFAGLPCDVGIGATVLAATTGLTKVQVGNNSQLFATTALGGAATFNVLVNANLNAGGTLYKYVSNGLVTRLSVHDGIISGNYAISGTAGNTATLIELFRHTGGDSFTVLGVGGQANPIVKVDTSTASQAAGILMAGAATGGTVSISAIDSGADTSIVVNAKGAGTIGIGSVSTGRVTITPATTITGPLTATGGATIGTATNPVQVGRVSDATTYGLVTYNGVLTLAGAMGMYARSNAAEGLYFNTPTGTIHSLTVNAVAAITVGISSAKTILVGTWPTSAAGLATGTLWNNAGILSVA